MHISVAAYKFRQAEYSSLQHSCTLVIISHCHVTIKEVWSGDETSCGRARTLQTHVNTYQIVVLKYDNEHVGKCVV